MEASGTTAIERWHIGFVRWLVAIGAWFTISGCNCGPASMATRTDGGLDAGVPVFGVHLCQAQCERVRDSLRRDFSVQVDCGQFPLFTSSCAECGAIFERLTGVLPAC